MAELYRLENKNLQLNYEIYVKNIEHQYREDKKANEESL